MTDSPGRWLTYLRRRWCLWRHHPAITDDPALLGAPLYTEPDRLVDGVIIPGDQYRIVAYRCQWHD